jgi:hypothetical protein
MSSDQNDSLAQVVTDMQLKRPGTWDGKFQNREGECYYESRHGLNPVGQGFNIFVRCPQSESQRCDTSRT